MPTDNTGWLNFSTFANDGSIGTQAWSSASNAVTSNNAWATAPAQGDTRTTNYLKATGPSGVSLPPDAQIEGIEVRIERRVAGDIGCSATDNSIRIVKGGTITGTNQSSGASWPGSDTYATFGSSSDLWGTAWSAADIGSSFGVVVSAMVTDLGALDPSYAYIDHIQCRITYSYGGMILVF